MRHPWRAVARVGRLLLALLVAVVSLPVLLVVAAVGWFRRGSGEDRYERRTPRWADED